MKTSILSTFLLLTWVLSVKAGDNENTFAQTYQYSLNLTEVQDDKLKVILIPPAIEKDEITFRFPKIVPGTYDIYDFGRFVSDFTVIDKEGNALPVEKVDENGWEIKQAKQIGEISYWVEDTWDTKVKGPFIFEPGGTNIEANKNFVLNTHGFFGYFEGMTKLPYRLNITKPAGFYGSTGLTEIQSQGNIDSYNVKDYMLLVDSPIMYNLPDTTVLKVGGAEILVSVHSSGKVKSKFIAQNIAAILKAQKEFLGGELPVKKYAFIIYLTGSIGGSGASGALEHSYSSLYFLPESKPEILAQTIRDVAAHEFFHIVTPLNIHSEQIANFDYDKPEMSEHLWLYEGVTEYCAGLVQVKHGLIQEERYLEVVREKMLGADNFNDTLPFTKMSKGCLDEYKDQYGNVYEKGALIGLCLDIKLRQLSKGKYGLQDLMKDLSKQYGKDKAFKDEELFDKIVQLTYFEIGDFFKRYVQGNEPLPFKEILAAAGIDYHATAEVKELPFLGGVRLGINASENKIMISEAGLKDLDDFGRTIGFRPGDKIVKFNRKQINLNNAEEILTNYIITRKAGDQMVVLVKRKDDKGKEKKVKLKARIVPVTMVKKHVLFLNSDSSESQIMLRNSWLGRR